MILNGYAVLALLVALLRLPVGLLITGWGLFGWLRWRGSLRSEERTGQENAGHLVFLLAATLVLLSLASWPLLYLLLQSYVPEWPGVMCIYGVTQIGKGSLGPARRLPDLLALLQWTKPLLIFAGGAWYVLYLLNQRTRTSSLRSRVFAALLPLGLLAVVDSGAELAYVTTPKKEEFPSAGCCTAPETTAAARYLPQALAGERERPWLFAAYYGINGALIAVLAVGALRARPANYLMPLMLAGAALALPASGLFLVEVLAPALLQLPFHHCAYDLIPQAPEGVAAVGLFLGGTFCLGWAATAAWLGTGAETRRFCPEVVRRLLRVGLWCYVTSLLLVSVGLAIS